MQRGMAVWRLSRAARLETGGAGLPSGNGVRIHAAVRGARAPLLRAFFLAVACAVAAQSPARAAVIWQQQVEPAAHQPGRVPPPGPYAPGFDALHYRIAIDLTSPGPRFRGRTEARIALVAPRQDTLRLDLTGLLVDSVRIGVGRQTSSPVSFRQEDGRIFIGVPRGANVGDTLSVDIVYGGEPDDGLIIRDNVHGVRGAFADNWPDRARFWFPSIDHPSDKATAEFEVRAPESWEVIANGTSARTLNGPRPVSPGLWRWSIAEPVPTYLMVIGATDFAIGTVDACARGGRSPARGDDCVYVGYWVFPQDSASGARIFHRSGDMVRYYSELIAPYPYARLEHVQSATRFGGMENATAIFYSERAITQGTLSEGTVSHETAHQWFGNAVTPARWADLWLSEGFATYFGMLYFEHAEGAARFREMREESWNGYLASSDAEIAVVDTTRVPDDNLLSLLNANSYNKGGAVLHMLRGLLGDSTFFTGIRRYYAAHVHGNAVTVDLQRVLEQASGRELGWFFEQWLYRPGHPILTVTHSWNAAQREVEVVIDQVQPAAWPTFRMPLEIELTTPDGPVRRRVEMSERRTRLRFQLQRPPTGVVVDPDCWVLKQLTPPPTPTGTG